MKYLITAILILSNLFSIAQEDIKRHQLKVNLLTLPCVDYEKGITINSTLGLNIGTELLAAKNAKTKEKKIAGIFLTFKGYYRHYLNFKRRVMKNKNIANNSANYITFFTNYIYTTPILEGKINLRDKFITIPTLAYGLQRTYYKKLNLGIELGFGYSISDIDQQTSPVINFNFGWLLL